MAAFNFAGLRFRFGIVLATTTTTVHANAQQRRPQQQQQPPVSAAAEPAASLRAEASPPSSRHDVSRNDNEVVDPTLQVAPETSSSLEEASGVDGAEGAAARNPSNCDERRSGDDEDPRGDVVAEDLGSVAADLREVSEALKLITRRRNIDDVDDDDSSDVRETSTDDNVDTN